jgi:hypothetical protein
MVSLGNWGDGLAAHVPIQWPCCAEAKPEKQKRRTTDANLVCMEAVRVYRLAGVSSPERVRKLPSGSATVMLRNFKPPV